MTPSSSRREFLAHLAGSAALTADVHAGSCLAAEAKRPHAPEHSLTTISGKPRERGRQYGRQFRESIHKFLDQEVYRRVAGRNASTRDDLLRYAGQCEAAIRSYSPLIMEELEGMAEGAGMRLEEIVLVTAHEEVNKKAVVLPKVEHCTALAAGPPDTSDGNTYVGQNWDWNLSAFGFSSMLLWKRPEGPSVLAYSYPGLWIGAGLNSAGIALCWTWGDMRGIAGPRVGIPAYVLIAQLLYQDTLPAALAEARRARHAGWFTFVLADGTGQLANIEGTPEKLAIETTRGHLARADHGTREITGTPVGKEINYNPKCRRMYELLRAEKGQLEQKRLQSFFADHDGEGVHRICVHGETYDPMSLDSMLFNCTTREAHIKRGPGCQGQWRTFGFET